MEAYHHSSLVFLCPHRLEQVIDIPNDAGCRTEGVKTIDGLVRVSYEDQNQCSIEVLDFDVTGDNFRCIEGGCGVPDVTNSEATLTWGWCWLVNQNHYGPKVALKDTDCIPMKGTIRFKRFHGNERGTVGLSSRMRLPCMNRLSASTRCLTGGTSSGAPYRRSVLFTHGVATPDPVEHRTLWTGGSFTVHMCHSTHYSGPLYKRRGFAYSYKLLVFLSLRNNKLLLWLLSSTIIVYYTYKIN